ncbi:MAG: hypothetical protein WC492_00805 [Candidatus Micrarchaeia archaeon]
MKGQLSAEMLIIMVLVLGLAFIAYTQMAKTTKNVGDAMDTKANDLINKTTYSAGDAACSTDADCQKLGFGSCDTSIGYCQ